jgi:hypothetical protein
LTSKEEEDMTVDITPPDALPEETPAEYFRRKYPGRFSSETGERLGQSHGKPTAGAGAEEDHQEQEAEEDMSQTTPCIMEPLGRSMSVPIGLIVVGERYRKDMGDLRALADNIRATPGGIIQPLIVDSRYNLIAGQRRLEAAKLLEMTHVPAIMFPRFDDALAALTAERNENTCRTARTSRRRRR